LTEIFSSFNPRARDPESDVRESAAEALGGIGGERVIDPLIEALRDPESDVRESAARALLASINVDTP
jgi:HEAT repeat protein